MLPDERAVHELVNTAIRRARWLGAIEGVTLGLAAATSSRIAGLVVVVVYGAWSWQRAGRRSVVQTIEHTHPGTHNLLVTADEISAGRLAPKALVRERVMAQAAASAARVDVRRAFPIRRAMQAVLLACMAWAIVGGMRVWRGAPVFPAPRVPGQQRSQSASSAGSLGVTVTVQPPSYSGLPSATVVDPPQIEALEGSTLALTIESRAQTVAVEQDGTARPVERAANGRFTGRIVLAKTGYLLMTAADGASRTLPVVVSPDALPSVRITVPGRDLVYAGGSPRITFDLRATDDFGLRSLALHYTKVSGSGEQFEFKDGEIPLSLSRATARDWHGVAARSLDEFDLKDGDMLVYRAVAVDQRPGAGSASSDAFFIEISKLGVAAGDAFTLPEEETRYALSQQMLIIKTERLHRARGSMAAEALADATVNLAVEQRMIRAEFVFMLGGEVQDEEVEAEQSTELQEGRLQNRGQRDLRAATVAMSQAEKLLTGANTAAALVAERAAVAALQRAFARDRYILRALASRANLDPSRRLAGDLKDASGWVRTIAAPLEDRRTAQLQDLTVGMGAFLREANTLGPARAIVLARQALRTDAESAALRSAATELQRVADTWTTTTPDARRKALETTAARVAAETARALADAPVRAAGPSLAGAFADALRAAAPPRPSGGPR